MKKILLSVLLGLFFTVGLFAFELIIKIKVPITVPNPSQNGDGTWDTEDGDKICIPAGRRPDDPQVYEEMGEKMPTIPGFETRIEKIDIPGNVPLSEQAINEIAQSYANAAAMAEAKAQENTDSAEDRTKEVKAVITVYAEAQLSNQGHVVTTVRVSASAPVGDPVLLSSGQYVFDEADISAKFQGIEFSINRHYESGKRLGDTLQSPWYISIDTRIVRSIKPDAKGELDSLIDLYDRTIVLKEESFRQYNELKKIYQDRIDISITQLYIYNHQKEQYKDTLTKDLTESSRVEVEGYLKDAENTLVHYTNLKADAELQLEYDNTNNPEGTLVKIRAEIAKQKQELSIQGELVEQSKRELAHSLANTEYNRNVLRDESFMELLECGNDVIKVYDRNGSAFTYKINNGPVYGNDLNHYPQGSETSSLIPGDVRTLRLLPDGSFEWKQNDGSIWYYNTYGFLTKIQNIHGVEMIFVYDKDFYLQDIRGKDGGQEYALLHFTWNGDRLTSIENSRDKTEKVVYTYNNDNVLSTVTDTDGDTVRYEYSNTYLLTKIIKPEENKRVSEVEIEYGLEHNGKRLVSSTTNEEGKSEYFLYSKDNALLTYTDHSKVTTEYTYDENHRKKTESTSDGKMIAYEYDADGNMVKEAVNVIEEAYITGSYNTTYTYDNRGNKTSAAYSDGSSEQWAYNGFDKITNYKDRDGKTITYIYDTKGNLLSISQGNTLIFSAVYNEKGLMTQSTEGKVVSTYEYDAYGNVIKRTQGSDSEKIVESWSYDGRNRVTSYTNSLNEKTSYTYTAKETTVNYPDGLKIVYLINSRKDLVKVTQTDTVTGEVRVMDYIYDRRHKLIETKINGKTSAKYTYKGAGELESELYYEDGEGWKKEYVYDSAGRIEKIQQYKADSEGNRTGKENEVYVQSITYEKSGVQEIIKSIDPLNRTTTQILDQWKRVTSVTNPMGETAERGISSAGRVTKLESSFGGSYTYEYDNAGRMSGVIEEESNISVKVSYNADGTVDTQTDQKGNVTSYTYNDLRQLTKIQGSSSVTHYTYDKGGRVHLVLTGGNGSKESAEAWTEYLYDKNGRIVNVNRGGAVFVTQHRNAFGEVTSVIDGEGNTTQYKYNDKGQLTDVIDPNGYTTSYAYNALGKIKALWYADSQVRNATGNLLINNASLKYEYNYLGLVAQVTDKKGIEWSGVYDKAGRLIKETGRLGLNKEYTYDVLDRITEVKSGGVIVEKYSYTNRGKTITYTDGKGSTYTYSKDSYGKLVTEVNRLGTSQSYTYEKDGSVKTKTDFETDIKTTDYNDANRTKTVTYSDGRKEIFTYTMSGFIETAETKTGKIVYTYNKGGLLIKQEDLKAGETTTYTYDKAGRRTGMNSGNREVRYVYGKAGELVSINDNKQRLSVSYKYDSLYRETERVFGNGVVQKTQYTVTGQTELITEVNARGELLRSEGYVYDEGGRRIYTITEKGQLTHYTYDAQSRLSNVLYPYTEEKKQADQKEAEEEGVHYLEGNVKPENIFLSLEEKALIVPLLEKMGWGRSSYLTTTQVLWQETYTYDANGNRTSKTTPFGTIRYWYDAENRLVHSGSDEGRGSDYTYDANGNLLTKTNLYKTEEYEYNLANRMSMSTVTDHIKKTKTITHYDYDAFGRRTLVQDEGGKIIRTLYDGLSFDIIREEETFADGYFTNTSDTGIAWGTVSEGDGSRYRYIGDDTPASKEQNGYSVAASNRASSRVALYANGQAVGVNRSSNYASSERSYFGTDLMGTVRSSTTDSGNAEYYEYDVFGKPYGETVSDYAYTGKPYDPVTGMYNYGYRDYVPQTARFTTIDPIRDGSNWFAYCNNEPVNFLDAWGLSASDAFNTENFYDGRIYGSPFGFKDINSVYGYQYPIKTIGSLTSASGEYDYYYKDEYYRKPHNGAIDIAAKTGTPVYPIIDGKVIKVLLNDPAYGNSVYIDHGNGVISQSSHLNTVNVKEGDLVSKYKSFGTVGNTGKSTGSHLDFRIKVNGVATDPIKLIGDLPYYITPEIKKGYVKKDENGGYVNWLLKE